jgi:hypothetical protein
LPSSIRKSRRNSLAAAENEGINNDQHNTPKKKYPDNINQEHFAPAVSLIDLLSATPALETAAHGLKTLSPNFWFLSLSSGRQLPKHFNPGTTSQPESAQG